MNNALNLKTNKPIVIHLPFSSKMELLLIQGEKAISPVGGLQKILPFEADGIGGWICAAKAGSDKWGYLNDLGEWVVPPTLDDAKTFSEGIARFCENNLWGFINLRGEKITPAIYPNATAFRHGFARVQENGLWGVVNDRGEKAIAAQFHNSTNFCKGFASVEIKPNEWKIINDRGEFACEQSFGVIKQFSENGLAAASLSEAQDIRNKQIKFGYINTQGQWVIAPKFCDANAFGESHLASAAVEKDCYGLIDENGNWVVEPKHKDIYPFNEYGLAFFADNGWSIKHGFLDAEGKIIMAGGYHLKSPMPCGIARENSTYYNAHGEKLSSDIQYGIDFDEELQAAIVNIKSETPMGSWGFLQANGEVYRIGGNILEPLVNGIGWVDLQFSSSAVPFLNKNNGVSWLNGRAEEVYSAAIHQGIIELTDAQGKLLWKSSNVVNPKTPDAFFNITVSHFFENIKQVDDLQNLSQKMLADSEMRLHSFVKNEKLIFEKGDQEEGRDYDYSFEELFCYDDEEDLEGEVLSHEVVQSYLICERQKVLHLYQNEFHTGTYDFLWDSQLVQVKSLQSELVEKLTRFFGEPDPDPEFIAYWGEEQAKHQNQVHWDDVFAWRIPLQNPISDQSLLPDGNYQWLILYVSPGWGDGDQWQNTWLMSAPSVDAIYVAKAIRNKKLLDTQQKNGKTISHKIVAPEVDAPELPVDYQSWLEIAKQHHMNISEIPEKWIDDKMVDAAISANIKALTHTPAKWQTAARLKKLIEQNLGTALAIPPQCMTEEGLELARSLYEHTSEWNSHDSRCCELPSRWDQDSFYQVWGCLLDASMARKGIVGGASLNNLAVWLRTDEIEMLAVCRDTDNLRYIDKKKITPELLTQIGLETDELIDSLPFELLTPALCLNAILTHSVSLRDVPAILRVPDICVAALKNNFPDFIYVPDRYRIQVVDELIRDFAVEVDADDTYIAYLYCQRAWAKLWAQDYQGAIDDVTRSLDKCPDEADAYYIRACAYLKLGKFTEAYREAEKVLSLDSNYKTPWANENTHWLVQIAQQKSGDSAILQKNPVELESIAREHITEEIIQIALAADPQAIQYVPKRFMNSERYLLALKQGHKKFRQIPTRFLNEEICIEYVRESGRNLGELPNEFKTFAVCLAAVKSSSYAIKLVPEVLREKVKAVFDIAE